MPKILSLFKKEKVKRMLIKLAIAYLIIFVMVSVVLYIIFNKRPPGYRNYFPDGYEGYYCIIVDKSLPLPEIDSEGFRIRKFDENGRCYTGESIPEKGLLSQSFYLNKSGNKEVVDNGGWGVNVSWQPDKVLYIGRIGNPPKISTTAEQDKKMSIEDWVNLYCPIKSNALHKK